MTFLDGSSLDVQNYWMRKFIIYFSLLAFLVTTLPFESEAAKKKKRRARRAKRGPIINEPKLYERMGGAKTVSELVDEWVRMNLADQRVAPLFKVVTEKPDRLIKMRRSMNDQICEIADGPCKYKGGEMDKVHSGMGIQDDQFLYVSENLLLAMQKLQIAEREKNELLGRIGEMRADFASAEAPN